jgi:hypothetical protein
MVHHQSILFTKYMWTLPAKFIATRTQEDSLLTKYELQLKLECNFCCCTKIEVFCIKSSQCEKNYRMYVTPQIIQYKFEKVCK